MVWFLANSFGSTLPTSEAQLLFVSFAVTVVAFVVSGPRAGLSGCASAAAAAATTQRLSLSLFRPEPWSRKAISAGQGIEAGYEVGFYFFAIVGRGFSSLL